MKMKCIFVKSVEIEEVKLTEGQGAFRHAIWPDQAKLARVGGPPSTFDDVRTEIVEPKLFVNTRGQRVLLAQTNSVQRTIGLSFAAFANQQESIERLRSENDQLCREQTLRSARIDTASFWRRLKYLLTGEGLL